MSNSELKHQSRSLIAKLSDNKNYIVTQLIGEERVSEGYLFSLSIAANSEIDVKVLGKSVSVTFNQPSGKRYFTSTCAAPFNSQVTAEKNNSFTIK